MTHWVDIKIKHQSK